MNIIRIISFDPSSKYIGCSIMDIDYNLNIKRINTLLINVDAQQHHSYPFENVEHRLNLFSNYLRDFYHLYKPDIVSYESGFMHSATPNAFGILSKFISMITYQANTYDNKLPIYKFSPSEVKVAFNQKGNCPKEDMITGINSIDEIICHLDINSMSEHEIDAVAIGYATLKLHRNNPQLLIL